MFVGSLAAPLLRAGHGPNAAAAVPIGACAEERQGSRAGAGCMGADVLVRETVPDDDNLRCGDEVNSRLLSTFAKGHRVSDNIEATTQSLYRLRVWGPTVCSMERRAAGKASGFKGGFKYRAGS